MTPHGQHDGPDRATVLERRLGLRLHDRGLLRLALTHRSHAFEAGGLPSNERLEFLGDAVLGLVVTAHLYRRMPDAPEGRLAKLRAAAVSTPSLADVARGLALGQHVLLGRGEAQSGGADKDSILADTLEAVLGAVYLDRGLQPASAVIHTLFEPVVDDLAGRDGALDHKTALQESVAARGLVLPRYDITEEGPDHAKRFEATAVVDGRVLGTGQGRTKKEAEQRAAAGALDQLHRGDALASESGPG